MNDSVKPEKDEAVSVEEESDTVLLAWVTHPARARPLVTLLVVIFLTILVVIVYNLTASLLFTIVGALILWGSLSQYFMPTRFELTGRGVRIKYTVTTVTKEWNLYRSYYADRNGVLLSPFIRPSRLENFRGQYVRFAGNRDEVMKIVSDKIKMIDDNFELPEDTDAD
ncbi:MAG: hypothetical protein KAT58_02885 [candidate division Zixibacteria bacterium]|nr:hypothetical protein [candidate division Zixibacteria bacterium]